VTITNFTTAIERELERREREHGTYNVAAVPPAPDRNRSRFGLITRSPSGIDRSGAANLGGCALTLAHRYIQEGAERALPEAVVVKIQKLAETTTGEIVAVSWPRLDPLARVPSFLSKRPGKLGQTGDATAAEIVDSFLFQDGIGWEKATDAEVFRAAVEVANIEGLRGSALSDFSAAIARLVAARAGVELTAADIP
jgi:hypothetical protein